MLHCIKRFWAALALILAGAQTVFGYAMLGPNEPYQIPTIGYQLRPPSSDFYYDIGGTVDMTNSGPKNFGQGYRWNTPTNYYACTREFRDFFGSNGVAAVDAAFSAYNNLTNMSGIDPNAWPNAASRVNYTAQPLHLYDLKSMTMSLIIEQLGLGQPDRWVWCLNSRYIPGGATCPNYEYLVIQRNFDPITGYYSQYVNGVLYDYQIAELCGLQNNQYAPLEADAIEVLPDPAQQSETVSSVAAYATAYVYGSFFQSFTRDDIGGLKALYSPTNAYPEQALTNAVQVVTNNAQTLLVTSNLSIFFQQALTNDDPTLAALYPGLVIFTNLTTNTFTLVLTTNVIPVISAPPYAPAGTLELTFQTNYATNVETLYHHTFGNVFIVHSYPQSIVGHQIVQTEPVPYAPAGTVKTVTNVNFQTIPGMTNGDFYILPTNLCEPYVIVSNIFTNVVAVTNYFTNFANITNLPPGFTNTSVTTNFNSYATIFYYTNHFLAALPVTCSSSNIAATRGGMDKFSFVHWGDDDLDPVLGIYQHPFTNTYHLTAISNGLPVVQTFMRVVTAPDILIDSSDFSDTGGPGGNAVSPVIRTSSIYDTALTPANNGGPGTIQSTGIRFVYNSIGPIYDIYGGNRYTLPGAITYDGQPTQLAFQWGSFDASTNTPILYPNTASVSNEEAQLYYQITTGLLPNASVSANGPGNPYTFTLQADGVGLVQPYTWTLTQTSGGLPPGLTLSTDGTISGSPRVTGTYDFTVQMTDAVGHTAQKDLFIEVDP